MGMLAQVRQAVADQINAARDADNLYQLPPVFPLIPDNPAHTPCLVVARPSFRRDVADEFELEVEVFVVGRRQGGEHADEELVDIADLVVDILHAPGPRGGPQFDVETGSARIVDVAGNLHDCYVITASTSANHCAT